MNNTVNMTPEVVDIINNWQTGGAELWVEVLQRSVEFIACNDSEDAAERLKNIGELIYLQKQIKSFANQEGGDL